MEYLTVLLSGCEKVSLYRASNGAEAVELFKKNSDIDLIFMDVRMPVMNGYKASQIIKEMDPDVQIIIQTANAFDYDKKQALLCGADGYITKPIDEEELKQLVCNEMKRKKAVKS